MITIPVDIADAIRENPECWRVPAMLETLKDLGAPSGVAQAVSNLNTGLSFTEVFDGLKPKNGTKLTPEQDNVSALTPICVSAWQGQEVPKREWIVPDWIPTHSVTGFGGPGGSGKSTLMLEVHACLSLGFPVFSQQVEPVKTLYISCEDDEDELHRRTHAISSGLGLELSDFSKTMFVLDMVGEDSVMVAKSGGFMTRTPVFHQLDQLMGDLKIGIVTLDVVADFWNGNENDKGEVNHFIKGELAYLTKRHKAGMVCLYHPSYRGESDGSGTAGSVAWNGSFRSRITLSEQDGTETRLLSRKKANYAGKEEKELVWRNGRMVEPSSLHTSPEDALVEGWETDFLAAMQYCDEKDVEVSCAPNSPRSYKKVFPEVFKKIDGRRRWPKEGQLDRAYSKAIIGGTIYETTRTNAHRARLHFEGYNNGH